MSNVLPARNLPGMAEDWGRAVETRLEGVQSTLDTVNSSRKNEGLFVGGQLAVTSTRLDNMRAMTTRSDYLGSISATGNATSEPYPRNAAQAVFLLDGIGGRAARVEVYGFYQPTTPGDQTISAYLSYQGRIISYLESIPLTFSGPFNITDQSRRRGMANIVLPPESDYAVTFDVVVVRVGFTSTVTTETLGDVQVYLTPYQRM